MLAEPQPLLITRSKLSSTYGLGPDRVVVELATAVPWLVLDGAVACVLHPPSATMATRANMGFFRIQPLLLVLCATARTSPR